MPHLRTLAATLLLGAAALPLGDAAHCQTWSTSDPVAATGPIYVDYDFVTGWLWIYEESNEIDGLQRGDEGVDDTCHGQIIADELIF